MCECGIEIMENGFNATLSYRIHVNISTDAEYHSFPLNMTIILYTQRKILIIQTRE